MAQGRIELVLGASDAKLLRKLRRQVLRGQQDMFDRLQQMENRIMAQQDDINALVTRVSTVADGIAAGVAGVRQDVQDLKDAQADGETLDLTALDASVAALEQNAGQLTALDAENPAAPTPDQTQVTENGVPVAGNNASPSGQLGVPGDQPLPGSADQGAPPVDAAPAPEVDADGQIPAADGAQDTTDPFNQNA
jgi:hypothetical protein